MNKNLDPDLVRIALATNERLAAQRSAGATDEDVQVKLAKGQLAWRRHSRDQWRANKLDTYFAQMLLMPGGEPILLVPQKFEGLWFVVQAQPQQERSVAGALIGKGITSYLPRRMRKVRINDRRHREMEWPMLPGYLFASFDPQGSAVSRINASAGAIGVLSCDGCSVPVPLAMMYRVRDREAEYATGSRVLRVDDREVSLGDAIQVIDGAFRGFLADVVEIDGRKERVKAEFDLFGRKTPLELHVSQFVLL